MNQKPSLPVVIEDPHINEWGVSLGGPNPTEELYFLCPDEATAWRLHDAIWNTHLDPDTFPVSPEFSEKMRSMIARRRETVAALTDPELSDGGRE